MDPYPGVSCWVSGHDIGRFLIDKATAVQRVRALAWRSSSRARMRKWGRLVPSLSMLMQDNRDRMVFARLGG